MHLTYRLPDFNEYFLCEYKQIQGPVCHRKKTERWKNRANHAFFLVVDSRARRNLRDVSIKCIQSVWCIHVVLVLVVAIAVGSVSV